MILRIKKASKVPEFLIIASFMCLLAACTGKQKETSAGDQPEEQEQQEITLTKVSGSPEYQDASLSMNQPVAGAVSGTEVQFEFEVENYQLGEQTEDAATKGLANSGKGQHIHLIVDNGPYSAHYEPSFTKAFEPGNHVILAFLSRSYHESVKNPDAFVVQQVTVGEDTTTAKIDLSAQHMFYSRPKGVYEGGDTDKLLLDFYLLNTTLSPEGNKVRATVNGKEFMIDEWAPYQLEGLPLGEVTVKLELLDGNGQLIPSPFNPVERTVTLKE
ncbi:hypothetical protein LVD17_18385 [Fulvivirga ulvae]|uniref:hypothetical protein n=1 Tax=Fulvivirga ulvae TaxID=2904245 RepID=UPI001F2A778A|nr:hypothetical protein [Fulvivirga ulvae]UII30264.1 hypothetical protein LVD17_18385 [Fulvivirga ulvae]